MSKAIFVTDMPNSCSECDFHNYHFCDLNYESVESFLYDENTIDDKPNWCPLKELPDEEHNDLQYDEYSDGYDNGWNSFRREILG